MFLYYLILLYYKRFYYYIKKNKFYLNLILNTKLKLNK